MHAATDTAGHPTCTAYVRPPARFCADHQEQARADRRDRDRFYDRHQLNPDARTFYNSAAWKRTRRRSSRGIRSVLSVATGPNTSTAKRPLEQCTRREALDLDNLDSLCQPHHNTAEAELRRQEDAEG